MEQDGKAQLSQQQTASSNGPSAEDNFCFPICELENDHVKLTPFIPSVHGPAYWEVTHAHPEIYTFLPLGPFPTLDAFLAHIAPRWVPRPDQFIFAIYSKASACAPTLDADAATHTNTDTETPYAFAGLCGYISTVPAHLSTEIAYLISLPAFQGTGVMSAAVALLMQYALLLSSEGGLGLRRVQYQTDANNERSLGLARKLGFRLEGVMRWKRATPGDKEGLEPRAGDARPETKGRHTAVLAVCWDDWEEGVKEQISRPGHVMYAA
ncbi:acyl-CoA N-acyltransferase [Lentinus tigrinus ALCF2SS1-7]|uniref:Acyl-CoA N-acyltransferase n=1 Tax=Lentinus tigrinus ALCF2SS1-6 TaxID=1328759 RepID=A0A5C2RSE1_9APHY|nr:acyl-CoA N-acyltransferase [Lentinus tigrinus ALCF2SS1-6]RPD70045.1 acyl-CoA N-acyltransferase [Lentinus tigrinus ALCF2SS1-7]